MMEVYRTPSKEVQEIILANVTYEAVIEGLNGYFASEPRNDYITVKMESNDRVFALYEAEAWADILISWLRTKHGIFYYPGMKAKKEDVWKNVMNCIRQEHSQNGFDLPRECQDLIEDLKKREVEIKELKERIAELESNFKAVCDEDDIFRTRALKAEEEVRKLKVELNAIKDTVSQARSRLNSKFVSLPGYEEDLVKLADIALKAVNARDETISRINTTAQKDAKQECYKYLWNALKELTPYCDALKIDRYEDLVDRIFYEMSLIEGGCKRCQRCHSDEKFDYIRRTNKAEEEVKKLKEQLDKATADYQALSEENQKLKNSVFDFSVINSKQKDRSFAILQDLYRDIVKKQPDGLSAEDIANKILDRVLTTEDLLHKSVDSVNKECKATGKLMVEDYEFKLKNYILKDIKKYGYRYDGLETKSVEEIVDRIIQIATCPRNEWTNREIENLRSQITRLKDLINAMNEEVKDM